MRKLAFVAVPLAALAVAVLASPEQLSYRPLGRAPSVSSTRTGAGSANWTTPANPEPTFGDPTVNVSPLFNTASATVTVEVGLYHSDGAASPTYTFLKRVSLGTATAPSADVATIGTGVWYAAEGSGVDSRGATHFDVRTRGAFSAGNGAFLTWTHGASGGP